MAKYLLVKLLRAIQPYTEYSGVGMDDALIRLCINHTPIPLSLRGLYLNPEWIPDVHDYIDESGSIVPWGFYTLLDVIY